MLNNIVLCATGDILEIGAQWAIATQTVDAFKRYMAQLKPYYFDYQYVGWLDTEKGCKCALVKAC
jgi:hypothetical protein